MPGPPSVPSNRDAGAAIRLRLHGPADLPALRRVRAPIRVRYVARAILAALPVLAFVLMLVPWQQSSAGHGRILAYTPGERAQSIDAPIDGRLQQWLVAEGDRVTAGEPLVRLLDNDPELLPRLFEQREALATSLAAARQQVISYEGVVVAAEAARELVIAEYDSKIRGLQRKRVGEVASQEAAQLQAVRVRALRDEGINSPREQELADMGLAQAVAALEALDQEIIAVRNTRDKAARDADAKIASARAEVEAGRAKEAEAARKLSEIDVVLSRQETQLVRAPRDGIVFRVHVGEGGVQVKKGDRLVTIVPETESRAVELWVAGNDMPFVQPGARVRMVFEGWPALQFVGLPGTSRGTFPGRVAFVDSTDDGEGSFRLVVVPDPEKDEPWPDPALLRQGVRVKGWVFLGRVSLGYELWRQLNAFPPLPSKDADKDKPWLPSAKKPRASSDLK